MTQLQSDCLKGIARASQLHEPFATQKTISTSSDTLDSAAHFEEVNCHGTSTRPTPSDGSPPRGAVSPAIDATYWFGRSGNRRGMARIEEVTVTMIDDLDGERASKTVSFALSGSHCESDLSKRDSDGLPPCSLKPYIEAGRKTQGRTSGRVARGAVSRSKQSRSENYDRAEVRAWANSHRIKVAERGRIASDVEEAVA